MKPINFRKFSALIAGTLLPLSVQAVPVKYPDCSNTVKINRVAGASGEFFNADCSALYVLPPRTGSLTVSGYHPSPNMDLECGRLQTIEQDQNQLDQLLAVNSQRLLQYEKDIQTLEANLRDGLIPVGKTADGLQNEIDKLVEKMAALRTQVIAWQDQNDERRLKFAQAEGGRGTFLIQNTYDELVKAYQTANPKLSVQKMVLDQSFLSINEQKAEDANSSHMPAVINLTLVGIGEMPLLLDPNILLQHKELAPYTAPSGSKIFGDALSGDIRLSNIGACALRQSLSSGSTFTASDVKDYIASTATYSYQVQVTRKYFVSYDFQELVRQIHEQVSHGGLFSTSTMNSLTDERRSTAWIDFKDSSDDQRFQYSDDDIREIKKEFLDRALAQIVSIQTGSPSALLALIDPSKNGASEAGDQLSKCPHVYCQIGAAGFKVLNAIFGSESAMSSLLKTLSGESTEKSSEKRMVPEYGTYSFQ